MLRRYRQGYLNSCQSLGEMSLKTDRGGYHDEKAASYQTKLVEISQIIAMSSRVCQDLLLDPEPS